jgi:hypothetical protein
VLKKQQLQNVALRMNATMTDVLELGIDLVEKQLNGESQ